MAAAAAAEEASMLKSVASEGGGGDDGGAAAAAESVGSDSGSFSAVQEKPQVCIEWRDVRVSFRVLRDAGSDSGGNGGGGVVYYDMYPEIDPNAPSSKSLLAQRRRLARSQKDKNPMTLSNLIGDDQPERRAGAWGHEPSAKTSKSAAAATSNGCYSKKCHICGRGFNKATYLKRHVLSHSSVKPYRCNVCNWGFFQHCNLKRHMVSHSVENGTEGFKCQHCKVSFTTRSVLSVHMRDAHGDKLVTKKEQGRGGGGAALPPPPPPPQPQQRAIVAAAAAAAKKPLPDNQVSSNGWSRCHVCNKNFLTPANLKQHMLLHAGRKPFKCNFCHLRFSQKSSLKKHLLRHTGNGGGGGEGSGHPCPNCGIHFRTGESLAQHVLRQHPVTRLDTSTVSANVAAAKNEPSSEEYDLLDDDEDDDDEEEEEEEIPAPVSVVPSLPSSISVTSVGGNGVQIRPFSCSICYATFDKVAMLNRHINQLHSVIGNHNLQQLNHHHHLHHHH